MVFALRAPLSLLRATAEPEGVLGQSPMSGAASSFPWACNHLVCLQMGGHTVSRTADTKKLTPVGVGNRATGRESKSKKKATSKVIHAGRISKIRPKPGSGGRKGPGWGLSEQGQGFQTHISLGRRRREAT